MKDIKTKSYVEKQYKSEYISYKRIEEQKVLERNSMKIENDGKMERFRFFDKIFYLDDGRDIFDEIISTNGYNITDVKKSNFSNWIYFGERLSYDEFIAQYKKNNSVEISNWDEGSWSDCDSVCHTQADSFFLMKEGDITFDELVAQKEEQDRVRMYGIGVSIEADAEAKKMKYTLMREGLTLVKPEKIE